MMRNLILTIVAMLGLGCTASAVAVYSEATIPARAVSGVAPPLAGQPNGGAAGL